MGPTWPVKLARREFSSSVKVGFSGCQENPTTGKNPPLRSIGWVSLRFSLECPWVPPGVVIIPICLVAQNLENQIVNFVFLCLEFGFICPSLSCENFVDRHATMRCPSVSIRVFRIAAEGWHGQWPAKSRRPARAPQRPRRPAKNP